MSKIDWRQDQKAHKRIYRTWYNMLWRCENPNDQYYFRYGGRGIKVCEDWRDFEKFKQWAYESGYDPYAKFMECTLDRIDNNGDYTPSNCRWVSMKQQTKNTSLNHYLTYKGETHSIVEWIEITGGKATTIYKRFELGMPAEKVLYPDSLNGPRRTKEMMERAVDDLLERRRHGGVAS